LKTFSKTHHKKNILKFTKKRGMTTFFAFLGIQINNENETKKKTNFTPKSKNKVKFN